MMQKNNIEVCRAKASDIPAIAALEKKCFSVPWSENAIRDTMMRDNALFLVAKKGGEVCGYIGSYRALDEGYITNVAVDPALRRCGAGRALVDRLIAEGEHMGLSFWTLEVRVGNAPAIALYKSVGFKNVGRRPRFYSNPCEGADLMTFYYGKERNL